jgi:hypothetical protein
MSKTQPLVDPIFTTYCKMIVKVASAINDINDAKLRGPSSLGERSPKPVHSVIKVCQTPLGAVQRPLKMTIAECPKGKAPFHRFW